VEASRGRIVIMAGGSVRTENVAEVVARSGVREVHARMDQDPAMARRLKRWAFAES
jgi:copper homeostasis protein CutC